MRLRILIVALVVVALGLGFFLGRFQATQSSIKSLQRIEKLSEAERSERAAAEYLKQRTASVKKMELPLLEKELGEFSRNCRILRAFDSGETNDVVLELEQDLEVQINVISAAVEEQSAEERPRGCLKCLRAWRDRRATHPLKEEDAVLSKAKVAKIISLINTNSP